MLQKLIKRPTQNRVAASPSKFQSGVTLNSRAAAILRAFGNDAHVYLPGAGYVRGFDAANFVESNGTSAGVVDGVVGYVEDATRGENIAPPTSSLTGWTAETSGIVTSDGIAIRVENGGALEGRASFNYPITIGESYAVTMTVAGEGATGSVQVGGHRLAAGGNGTRTLLFVATTNATTNSIRFGTNSSTSGHAVRFSNVSVRRAISATQSTTASKPILRRGHVNRARNSSMNGAVIGTPGTQPTGWAYGAPAGISRSIVATGTLDGNPYIDVRFFGTATAAADCLIDFEAVGTNIPAVTGQTWTTSGTFALVGGSWPSRPVALTIVERNSSNTFLKSTALDMRSTVVDSNAVRISSTRTLNQATTVGLTVGIRANLLVNDAIDFTIRIAAPQIELGSVANEYVPTTISTGASSSPSGPQYWQFDGVDDRLSLNTSPFNLNDNFLIIAAVMPHPASSNLRIVSVGSSASVELYTNGTSGTLAVRVSDGTTPLFFTNNFAGNLFSTTSVVTLNKQTNTYFTRRNGTNQSGGGASAYTNTLTGAAIGSTTGGGTFFNGSIGPVIIIKGTVSDADLLVLEKWVGSMSGVAI